jgi:fido (protein-threonine AMPylation protein)
MDPVLPPDSTNVVHGVVASKIWSQAPGFLVGVLSSALVALVVYLKQRCDDDKSQHELRIFLYTVWKQGGDTNQVAARIERKVDELLHGVATGKELEVLQNEFHKLDTKLRKEFTSKRHEKYVEDALAYKIVADAWSERAAAKLTFTTLDEGGAISLDRIQRVHTELFPEGYAWAGNTREQAVTIIRKESVSGRSVRPLLSTVATQVVEPKDIIPEMQRLIHRWNSNLVHIKNDNIDAISEELAHFHHEFALVHPFLDGNGRIARLITDEQTSFLFKRKIHLNLNGAAYYEALRAADHQESGQFKNLIKERIQQAVR